MNGDSLFGLRNVENNCYVNSIIQLFMNNDVFIRSLEDITPDVPSMLYYLRNLYHLKNLREKTFLELINYIQRTTGFSMREQNDAHEFLIKILDVIEKENKDIYNLFIGQKVSVLKCEKCNYKNEVNEDFNCLNFYLNRHDKFKNLLNSEFETSKIDGCSCEKCGNTNLINYRYINRFPKILIVLNSNMSYILSFVENLTIVDYHGETINFKFTGSVNHYGSLYGGHYTFSTKTHIIDDTRIRRALFPGDFKNAYMISYCVKK